MQKCNRIDATIISTDGGEINAIHKLQLWEGQSNHYY